MTTRRLWLITFGVFAAFALVWALGLSVRYFTAEVRGRVTAEERIQSGGSRIVGYEHFFDLCAAVQGHESQIEALRNELATAESERDRSRINASITGVSSMRARSIAQYNADALKDYTLGQFRDSDLPYQLNENGATSCVVR